MTTWKSISSICSLLTRAEQERETRIKAHDLATSDRLEKVRFFTSEDELKWKKLVDGVVAQKSHSWETVRNALKKYHETLQGILKTQPSKFDT